MRGGSIPALDGFSIDRMSKMKRKAIYLSIACITFLLGIIVVSTLLFQKSFRAVSYDGRGGVSTTDWKSSDGVMVYEARYYYSSEAEARKDIEDRLRGAATIIEREKNPYFLSGVDERIIAAFVNPETKEKGFTIIKLVGNNVHYVTSSSLEHALMFEKSWLKIG